MPQWNELWGGGNKDIQAGINNAHNWNNRALDLNKEWAKELDKLYSPYIDSGHEAFDAVYNASDQIRNNNIPEAFQHDTGSMQDLYSQYQQDYIQPQYEDQNLPIGGPDYANATTTDQYRALINASNNAQTNNNAFSGDGDIYANAANANTYEIADREYANAMTNYDLALANNVSANQQNQQNLQTGTTLEQYLYGTGQQNYENTLANEAFQDKQLTDYLSQVQGLSGLGMNATNFYGSNKNQLNDSLINYYNVLSNLELKQVEEDMKDNESSRNYWTNLFGG